MESKNIPNKDITQSSIYLNNLQYSGYQARLQNNRSWVASQEDSKAWIRVKLPQYSTVTAVETQGYDHTSVGYIERYTLRYSDNGTNWSNYTVNGAIKVCFF